MTNPEGDSFCEALVVLCDESNQYVIEALRRLESPVALARLAETIVRLSGEDPDRSELSPRKVEATLHHTSLPRLDSMGLLEYDSANGEVHHDETLLRAQAILDTMRSAYESFSPREQGQEVQTVIADVTIPSEQFAFGSIVREDPDLVVELERIVPLDNAILPFLWVSDGPNEHVEETLRSSQYVQDVKRLASLDDRTLYQVTWSIEVNGMVNALIESDAVLMEGHGTYDRWSFRLRFPGHEALRQFNDTCERNGIDVRFEAVYNPRLPEEKSGLSQTQRETIVAAATSGYFKVPREASLSDLSGRFGVSEQAISQRLRRGLDRLVTDTLLSEL